MAVDADFDIPDTGAVFTFGKSRFANNAPSKFWIKNDIITELACGDEHTGVVTESGRVFMIGSNDMGQLGLGSTKPVNKPSCVKSLKPEKALHIACGRSHTVVSCASGAVYVWGQNGDGQLGTGDKEDHLFPVKVLNLDTPAVAVAAGSIHSVVLTESGTLYIWGSNSEGQLGLEVLEQLTPAFLILPEPAINVACGYYHSVAVTEGGTVYSCGSGKSGELGQGGGSLECWLPQSVAETNTTPIVTIVAGDNHSSAITEDGYLLTWGCGRHGKLCQGEENFSSQFLPVIVRRLRHITVILVACGGCHTMVLGYRRSDETESAREENSQPLHHSVSSLARARRRVGDGFLPPLKSVGLPPIKHIVFPTVPDTEDAEPPTDDPQVDDHVSLAGVPVDEKAKSVQSGVTCDDNGVLDVESEEEEQNEEEEVNTKESEDQLSLPEKKGGRFSRFFSNLGKKKSSSLKSDSAVSKESIEGVEDRTVKKTKSKHPLEEDAHLESIGDPNMDECEESVRQVMEAFTSSEAGVISSRGTSGHKQSKACSIL
ncbi:X-linked retinitis pigmentosa GTPase regulator isoform X3 [Cherax quadricarinatus]|uniref:X-linked retinitis pigmentosa GTPase regulator isoform X3 n=1 Tax=Cherax quadricarinatus TaxID=27406 RepID=UPI00387E9CF9